jgi:hypothetical protein
LRRGARALVVLGGLLVGCGPRHEAPDPATAALYGAGLFSTGDWDFFMAFSPDGRDVLFCRANDDFSAYQILETRRDSDGYWRAPTRPSFAAIGSNADPHIAPDGRTVFFVSNRPVPGDHSPPSTYDIWYATLGPDGAWGVARHLPPPISMPGVDEFSPSVAANGDLYFGSERPGGRGGFDLWVARWVDGDYQPPENLGDSVNTAGNEVEPWIAPDQSYLILSGTARADSVGRYDLYVSRRVNGVWQRATPIGHGLNTTASEFNHSVSPDGEWLYFSSTRPFAGRIGERFDAPPDDRAVSGIGNGKGDIYRVATRELGW